MSGSLPKLPNYTFSIEDDVICCFDHKTGRSITNGVEMVVLDLFRQFGADLRGKRIIYRDTMDAWDGIAHRGAEFLGFVPLRLHDKHEAIAAARQHPAWPT